MYTAAERAALALTDEVTLIADGHVPADVEAEARAHFDEETYAALVFTIATINAWNRLAITSHSPPGATAEGGRRLTSSAGRVGRISAGPRNPVHRTARRSHHER